MVYRTLLDLKVILRRVVNGDGRIYFKKGNRKQRYQINVQMVIVIELPDINRKIDSKMIRNYAMDHSINIIS